MTLPPLSLPSDLASTHAALLAERAARVQAEAEAANAKARLSSTEALIVELQLLIGKLERNRHGPSRELAEWWGAKDFDPNHAALTDLNRAVENLVAKWARRTRRKT